MEVMHSVHAEGPSACPVCGGRLKKAIGVPAVHYKGSGWARKEKSGAAKTIRPSSNDSSSEAGAPSNDKAEGGTADSGTTGPAASGGASAASKDAD
jgi:predicted nucleic acid-binding Zn ribbon protein